jgi:thiol-disulfide isomerase/thioredoxin
MKKAILLLLACVFEALTAAAGTPGEVPVGGVLREARLNGLSVPPKKLSEFRGKPLLINVWASWCGPCRAEMGSLDRLARRYGGRQFNVIGISTDDDAEAAYEFLENSRISFGNFIDSRLQMENMLGADRLPLTLLVDAQGRVLARHYGGRDWDNPAAKALIAKTLGVGM